MSINDSWKGEISGINIVVLVFTAQPGGNTQAKTPTETAFGFLIIKLTLPIDQKIGGVTN